MNNSIVSIIERLRLLEHDLYIVDAAIAKALGKGSEVEK